GNGAAAVSLPRGASGCRPCWVELGIIEFIALSFSIATATSFRLLLLRLDMRDLLLAQAPHPLELRLPLVSHVLHGIQRRFKLGRAHEMTIRVLLDKVLRLGV